MKKIRFTADTLKDIVSGVFFDQEVNSVVNDGPLDWKGKNIMDVLNVHYYTFKHKAGLNEKFKRISQDQAEGVLDVLNQSYCLVSIDTLSRAFSKDIDEITVEGTLEYWIQSEKVLLLEDLIESANIATCGVKIPLTIDGEERSAIVYFSNLTASEPEQTELGETSVVSVSVSVMFKPVYYGYSDYKIEFMVDDEFYEFPVLRLTFDNSMVQRSIPRAKDPSRTSNLNLSNVTCFTIDYNDDKNNKVAKMFRYDSLKKAAENISDKAGNNKMYVMRLTDNEVSLIYYLNIKSHIGKISNSIDDDANTIVLVSAGGLYGTE